MNLFQFLNETDRITSQLSRKELEDFVHNLARVLPEKDRSTFLSRLKSYKYSKSSEAENRREMNIQAVKKIQKEAKISSKELRDVEEGRICLISEYNETYEDWYDESEEEFIYLDPEDICGILNRAAEVVHQCLDVEEYRTGYELAEQLFSLTVTVEGVYEEYDCEGMSLAVLHREDLLGFDIRKLLIDSLWAAWRVFPVEDRPEAFYQMICNSECRDFTLEEVFQSGERELDGQKQFLRQWISYLGTQGGKQASRLLSEALSLEADPKLALETARQFAEMHPELYEDLFLKDLIADGDEARLMIGQEALQRLEKGRVRGRIALMTAEAALRQNKVAEAEKFWLEAFLSDPTPVNYLRLSVECRDFTGYRAQAAMTKTDAALRFLNGDFKGVLGGDMNVKQALGWSYTFMKTGIALFLLYLYEETEEEKLPAGCRKMLDNTVSALGFTTDIYEMGILCKANIDSKTLFWSCFCKWRRQTPMPEALQERILKQIEAWLWLRVKGIMDANRRNYYGECAAFIAALGETLEFRGETGGKQRLMQSFRSEWPRRHAFRDELRKFGYCG